MNTDDIKVSISLEYDKAANKLKDFKIKLKQFDKEVTITSKDSVEAEKKMTAAWTAGFAALTVAAVKASRKVVDSFKNMINVYADFEQSLANTQSVAQASAADLGLMEDAARRVGRTTRSTASDAAKALYYLASAGFTAKESIKALDGVNALAIATNSDLAKTSETVATVIRQYGLDTSKATDIANTFTAAITNSLATMDKLAKSFEYVGPIASGLGLSVEETTGALELLYNKGFSGEKAGRGLRTILVNLADASSVVNKKLSKLGVTFDEVNPATNKLSVIFDNLRKHQVNATNAAAIFGKVSGVQLASLIAQSSDAKGGLIELTKAVTGTNRAFDAMYVQMDTLKGSMDKFKNAEEALRISTGKGLDGVLRSAVDTATAFVKALNKLSPVILGIGSAIGTLVAVTVGLTVSVFAFNKALIAVGLTARAVSLSFGSLFGAIGLVLGSLTLFIAGVNEVNKLHMKNLKKDFTSVGEDIGITKDKMDDFVKTAGKARDRVRDIAGVSRINSYKDLVAIISKVGNRYGFTYSQMLKISNKSKDFVNEFSKYEDQLQKVADEQERFVKNQADKNKGLKEEHELHKKLATDANNSAAIKEQQYLANTSTVFKALKDSFKEADTMHKVLGKDIDMNSAAASAFKTALRALAEKGLGADSREIIALKKLYADLRKEYNITTKKKMTDYTALRKADEADLREKFRIIDEKAALYKKEGKAFDAASEKSKAVLMEQNKMLEQGFTARGAGMQHFLEMFSQYIKSADSEEDKYMKMLDVAKQKEELAGATAVERLKLERQWALDQAGNNEKLIKSINTYYDYEEMILGLEMTKADIAKENKALDEQRIADLKKKAELDKQALADMDDLVNMTNEYEKKNKDFGKSKLELLKEEHAAKVKLAGDDEYLISLIDSYYGKLEDKEAVKEFADNFKEAADDIMQLLDDINTIQGNAIKQQIADEKTAYDQHMQQLNDQEQAEVDAVAGSERDKLVAKVKAAQEAYDNDKSIANKKTLDEAKNALKIYDIHKKFLKKKEDAEKAYKNKIAQMQYKQDISEWEADIIKATINAAVAVAKLVDNPPMAVLAGILGAAQVAVVASNKPKEPPKFNSGGIVPGNSYSGDTTPVLANAGELILNKAQQETVANQINEPTTIIINTYLDGKKVAESSAEYYRNGQVRL